MANDVNVEIADAGNVADAASWETPNEEVAPLERRFREYM